MSTKKPAGEEVSQNGHGTMMKYVGGAALVLLAVGVAANFPDIKRYIRISTM